jgi:hypothetical protein
MAIFDIKVIIMSLLELMSMENNETIRKMKGDYGWVIFLAYNDSLLLT